MQAALTTKSILVIKRGDKDVTSYYEITYEKGTLKVKPAPLKIKTPSASKKYDGKPLTAAAGADAISGLKNGETVTVTATGSQTKVGSSQNTYTLSWGSVKADNYTIAEEDLGTLTVEKADKKGIGTGDSTSILIPAAVFVGALILFVLFIMKRKKNK